MDPLTIGVGLASLFSGAASLFASHYNRKSQEETNEKMIELENNAVQRRKADLIAAGFNPVLAAGSAAGTPSLQAPTFDNDFSFVNNAISAASQAQGIAQTQQQVKLMKEQETSVANQNALFDLDKQIKEEQLRGAQALTRERQLSSDEKEYNLGLYRSSGMPTNASMAGKMVNEASNAAFRAGNAVKNSVQNSWGSLKSGLQRAKDTAVQSAKNDASRIGKLWGSVKSKIKSLTTSPEEAYNKSRK